uniref:Exodeoxyribonuclease 7 small subunit n=1 Tax=uncultured Alphaproteobacteria bacterium TaxID=91750 RepID=A0A6G8F261_9PROT|nr:exodeoxyribonuclease 7 small subunit [uncultured Alphaproteobacteria bacterium]
MSEENIDKLSFEEALSRLENLVRELEAGRIKLDDAVNAYEQAVALKKFCEKKLNDAKLKIEKIEIAPDGTYELTPLDKTEINERN